MPFLSPPADGSNGNSSCGTAFISVLVPRDSMTKFPPSVLNTIFSPLIDLNVWEKTEDDTATDPFSSISPGTHISIPASKFVARTLNSFPASSNMQESIGSDSFLPVICSEIIEAFNIFFFVVVNLIYKSYILNLLLLLVRWIVCISDFNSV